MRRLFTAAMASAALLGGLLPSTASADGSNGCRGIAEAATHSDARPLQASNLACQGGGDPGGPPPVGGGGPNV